MRAALEKSQIGLVRWIINRFLVHELVAPLKPISTSLFVDSTALLLDFEEVSKVYKGLVLLAGKLKKDLWSYIMEHHGC